MNIIGIVGENASGKDELAHYVEKMHGGEVISTGNIVRELAEQENIEPTRDNLHQLSERYLEQEGRDFFARKVIDKVESSNAETIAVTGVRTPEDAQKLRKRFDGDFILAHVDVSHPFARFERSQERKSERDPGDFDEFKEQDREERQLFDLDETIKMADVRLNNDGTVEAFHKEIDEKLINRHLEDEQDEE